MLFSATSSSTGSFPMSLAQLPVKFNYTYYAVVGICGAAHVFTACKLKKAEKDAVKVAF
jgi:hypothetical protein